MEYNLLAFLLYSHTGYRYFHSNILTHVDPNLFGKIRSSCIVNLEYVQEVVRDELLLKNGESLFVSRNYRHTIKSQHLNFIRNHF